MISPKKMIPKTRGTISLQLITIQVTFSATANPTRMAPSVTNKAIFLARLVMRIIESPNYTRCGACKKETAGRIAPRSHLLEKLVYLLRRLVSRSLLGQGFFAHRFERKSGREILHPPEFRKLWQRDIPRQSQFAKSPDAVPVGVNFVPGDAVAGRLGNSMVIVMPAFAKGKNGYPEAVGRIIAGQEALRPPHVRCR